MPSCGVVWGPRTGVNIPPPDAFCGRKEQYECACRPRNQLLVKQSKTLHQVSLLRYLPRALFRAGLCAWCVEISLQYIEREAESTGQCMYMWPQLIRTGLFRWRNVVTGWFLEVNMLNLCGRNGSIVKGRRTVGFSNSRSLGQHRCFLLRGVPTCRQ